MIALLRREWKVIAGFTLVLLLVYGHSVIGNEYVNWDDYNHILDNPVLQTLTLANIGAMFSMYDPDLYVPLTFLSFQFDRLLGGGEFLPQVTHGMNLLLHLLSSLLVVGITTRLSRNRWVGIVTGLLFAVHPLHTEAVAWASARKDVLSVALMLASLWGYLVYRAGQENRRVYLLSITAFLCALLAKVIAITLPVILLLIDFREGRRIDRACLKEKIPYLLFSLVFGIVAIGGKTDAGFHLYEKVLIGCRSIMLYIEKIFIPTKLATLYPFTEPIAISNPELAISVVAVTLISIIALWSLRFTRELFFMWAFFLVTVFPTLTNFTKGDNLLLDVYIGSDRYAYVPSIAVIFLVVLPLNRYRQHWNKVFLGCVTLVVALFSYLSYKQSLYWRDTAHVFLNVIQHYDNSHHAHNSVGKEFERRGMLDLAEQEYRKSLSIRLNEKAFSNLGRIFMKQKNYGEARDAFFAALQLNEYHVEANVQFGELLLILGKPEETLKLTEFALEFEPENVQALEYTATAYEALGDVQKAAEFQLRLKELVR